jgi:hypothetical protein
MRTPLKIIALCSAGAGLWAMLFGHLGAGLFAVMCGLLIAHDQDQENNDGPRA